MKTGKLVCASVCYSIKICLRIHMQLLKATNYESKFVASSSQQPKQRCFKGSQGGQEVRTEEAQAIAEFNLLLVCVITGFRHDTDDTCALLGHYAANRSRKVCMELPLDAS